MLTVLQRTPLLILAVAGNLMLSSSCDFAWSKPTPTPTAPPTSTPLPPTPIPTPVPTPLPTPRPELLPGISIVVGGVVRTRADPSTTRPPVGVLQDGEQVQVVARVQGENWLVGRQTWVASVPVWASEWLQLEDGTYVYGAFVFTLLPEETTPLLDLAGEEKWIDVNLTEQTVRAMVGDRAMHLAPATTGASGFETPRGTHYIEPDGRIAVERMTASQAGYEPSQARYDVERVLFTQYFDQKGDSLHLNYWRPESAFGSTPTSHGCVGLLLHDAQYFWLFAEPGMRVEIHD